jgi:hypothetical protein
MPARCFPAADWNAGAATPKAGWGDGANTNSLSPVAVFGLAQGVKAVAAGHRHTCALMETGEVKCWGENASDGVGDGIPIDRNTPVEVPGLAADVKAVEPARGTPAP